VKNLQPFVASSGSRAAHEPRVAIFTTKYNTHKDADIKQQVAKTAAPRFQLAFLQPENKKRKT
jgi:hypothetical protein